MNNEETDIEEKDDKEKDSTQDSESTDQVVDEEKKMNSIEIDANNEYSNGTIDDINEKLIN